MSELIKHECGIALLRLRKPPEYYFEKYGTMTWGLRKIYLMMEKQHNRGQDGAGLAGIKINAEPGSRYLFRERSDKPDSIIRIFRWIYDEVEKSTTKAGKKGNRINPSAIPFICDVYLGHLRYGTYGTYSLDQVHPVSRENNWRSRTLVMAGNFNLTNVTEIFRSLVDLGQNPVDFSDTVTILENIGFRLEEENDRLMKIYLGQGLSKKEASEMAGKNLDIVSILSKSSRNWDGGYVMAGMIGHGDAFVLRDPNGIRPAFYYADDEVAVVASERPVIQTVFNADYENVKEIPPAHAFIVKADGTVSTEQVREPGEPKKCSFERIYFSRGTDREIYSERKKLGELLTHPVLSTVGYDLENTVFSYIPNTAESAFYGLLKGIEEYLNEYKTGEFRKLNGKADDEKFLKIISLRPRVEKIAVKDVMLRTFITKDKSRNELVGHVYDITYGTVRKGTDNLVVIDDSIVRGTTLRTSIIKILDRLGPKKIVVVSSSPQIRYPDCYGIDMAKLGDFIAFKAAVSLLEDEGDSGFLDILYQRAKDEIQKPVNEIKNLVKEIYDRFSENQIARKISELLRDEGVTAEIEVVYQTVESLHKACPGHTGDWYFTGIYPTPGGNKVVNQSFINYIEGKNSRAY